MAFEALEAFPALAESRNRLLTVISKDHVATADVVSAVESDVALIIAVLRLANRAEGGRGKVDSHKTVPCEGFHRQVEPVDGVIDGCELALCVC